MPEAKLTAEELRLLRAVLATLTIRARTGEVGITHGLDRFISTQVILKQQDRDILDSAARKVGLSSGIKRSST